MIDILDLNVQDLVIGRPGTLGETLVYPLRYNGETLKMRMPPMGTPFGIKNVSQKTHLLNFTFGRNYEENDVYHKFQEIDEHLDQLFQEKVPGLRYESAISVSLKKDSTGQLVETEHPPTFCSSLRKTGKFYQVQVEAGKLKQNVMNCIDIEGYVHPGAYLSSAHSVPCLVQSTVPAKDGMAEYNRISLRFKLLKVKVCSNTDNIDLEDAHLVDEFQAL